MNSFHRHHRDSIQFDYSCFDRLILNGCVLPFMHTSRSGSIRWFLRTHRGFADVSRAGLAKIAADYHRWVESYALQAGLDIVEPEKGARREELVEPYFQHLGSQHGIAVIFKAREPERIACQALWDDVRDLLEMLTSNPSQPDEKSPAVIPPTP